MTTAADFDALKLELSVRAKNGLDFIGAATVLWAVITVLWLRPASLAQHCVFTLMASGAMLPLALLFSKLLGTNWAIKTNPLQPLGLWLNLAQLFYFPLLVFFYLRAPEHFLMAYGVITGAHFFPYAWFYGTRAYAVAAGGIAGGCVLLGLRLAPDQLYLIPAFLGASLLVLAGALALSYRRRAPRLAALGA